MIYYIIMYKQAILNSLIKCATGAPTADDMLAAINLTKDLGDAMSVPRVKGMPFRNEVDPLKYSVNMSDKTLRGGAPALTVNQSDPASVSLLLGRAANDYKKSYLPENDLWNKGWTWGTLSNVIDTVKSYGDTKTSWKAIEKAYKDHPEIIKDFAHLRNRAATAKLKYNMATTLPSALLGSYLGYKFFKGNTNLFSKKKHPILHYLTRGAKGLAGFALGSMIANGASHLLGIPQYYKQEYDRVLNDPAYVYRSTKLNQAINNLH